MLVWLVAGGAGYIGSHVVRSLVDAGEGVVVVDDLSTGSVAAVPRSVPLITGSVLDAKTLDLVFKRYPVQGVIYLVAGPPAGTPAQRPVAGPRQNSESLRLLLPAMRAAGVRKLVHSSSAAAADPLGGVTGQQWHTPPDASGQSPLTGGPAETAPWAHRIDVVHLRHFNVLGAGAPALADRRTGHLVPRTFERLASGLAPEIFGDDYPTRDGTCLRDYVHVADVASAYVAATRYLCAHQRVLRSFEVGRGQGLSVRDLIATAAAVTGVYTEPVVLQRRPGDPAQVVADPSPIRHALGWSARHSVLDMITSAWEGWFEHHLVVSRRLPRNAPLSYGL